MGDTSSFSVPSVWKFEAGPRSPGPAPTVRTFQESSHLRTEGETRGHEEWAGEEEGPKETCAVGGLAEYLAPTDAGYKCLLNERRVNQRIFFVCFFKRVILCVHVLYELYPERGGHQTPL